MKLLKIAARLSSEPDPGPGHPLTFAEFGRTLDSSLNRRIEKIGRYLGRRGDQQLFLLNEPYQFKHPLLGQEVPIDVRIGVHEGNIGGFFQKAAGASLGGTLEIHVRYESVRDGKFGGNFAGHISSFFVHELVHVFNQPLFVKPTPKSQQYEEDGSIDYEKYFKNKDEQAAFLAQFSQAFTSYLDRQSDPSSTPESQVRDFLSPSKSKSRIVTVFNQALKPSDPLWRRIYKNLYEQAKDRSRSRTVPIDVRSVESYVNKVIIPFLGALHKALSPGQG